MGLFLLIPLVLIPLIGLLLGILIVLLIVLLILLWYFFINDRNLVLALYERIGRGTKRFSGKVVWLVGASTNFGEGMALELATAGAKLILSAKKTDILEKIKADCIEKSKGKLSESDIFVLPFDATEMNEKYVQNAIDHFGQIDVFISNLGHTEQGQASEVDIQSDIELFDVNFFGPVFLAKHVVKHFEEMGGGQIIIISSLSGKFSIPGQASDSASRQALHGYFDSLRYEKVRQKIYVTIVCLGLIKHPISDDEGTSKITKKEKWISQRGMKAKRCAHLALVAGINKFFECSVANQPFLFLVIVAQYLPGIHKFIMSCIFSQKRLEKIFIGKAPGILSWKTLFWI